MCVFVSVFLCVYVSVCMCVCLLICVCVCMSPPVEVKISGCSLRATVWGVPKLVTRIASTTWDNNIFVFVSHIPTIFFPHFCICSLTYNYLSSTYLCSVDEKVDQAANKNHHPAPATLLGKKSRIRNPSLYSLQTKFNRSKNLSISNVSFFAITRI